MQTLGKEDDISINTRISENKKEGLMFEIYFLVFGLDFALVLGLGFGFVKFFMFRTAIL